ncbi:family 43 glycosylhydrolase [Niabella terrae]
MVKRLKSRYLKNRNGIRRMSALILMIAMPLLGLMAQKVKKPYTAYLFAYFTGNAKVDESIHFALSMDGFHYVALNGNQPVIASDKISKSGGVRDPHILRAADGKTFYMVVTDMVSGKGWDSNRGMVLLKSEDLLNWTSTAINIPETFKAFEKVNRVWAPQTIYDARKKQYMIYWSMRAGTDPDVIYYAYANKDFTGFETEPRQLFFSPTQSACIDGEIIFKDGLYHLFFKTEGSGKGIKVAVSDQLTEGYKLRPDYVQQTRDPVEGAGVFPLNDGSGYILMYDVYTKGKYQFTKSADLTHFKVVDDEISMDFHPRHGTVMPITTSEAQRLIKHWMQPRSLLMNPGAAAIRKQNLAAPATQERIEIPVLPGTDLKHFNPGYPQWPGVKIRPSGARDFSRGSVRYKVSIKGRSPQTFSLQVLDNHNPVLNGFYADPEILYARKTNKFYLYPTSDGYRQWSGNYFKVFSSDDLVNWKDEGRMLDLPTQVSWANRNAWAPCIIEKQVNGVYQYYYYFTAAQKIGVAVADHPTGPFKDSGRPLIAEKPAGIRNGQEIDPDVFTDPRTGKSYLYWGNGYLAGAELNSDMISIKPETITQMKPDGSFREGTYVFYREGIYYFMWSENDTRSPDYRVRYGTATSPLGKITVPANNIVIQKDTSNGIYGTGHNSVLQLPGSEQWYLIYHRFNYPNGINMGEQAGYNRETCIDPLYFNADGSIRPVRPTHKGIEPVLLPRQ